MAAGKHSRLAATIALLVACAAGASAFQIGELNLEGAHGAGCVAEHGLKCTDLESLVGAFEHHVSVRDTLQAVTFLDEMDATSPGGLKDPQAAISADYQGPLDMSLTNNDDRPDAMVADPAPKVAPPATNGDDDDDDEQKKAPVDEDDFEAAEMAKAAQREEDQRLAHREEVEAKKEMAAAKRKEHRVEHEEWELTHGHHKPKHHSAHRRRHGNRNLRRRVSTLDMSEEDSRTDLNCASVTDAAAHNICQDAQSVADLGDKMASGAMTVEAGVAAFKALGTADKLGLGDDQLAANWKTVATEACNGDLKDVKFGEGPEDGCGSALKKTIEATVGKAKEAVVAAGGTPAAAGGTATAAAGGSEIESLKAEIKAEVKKQIDDAKAESEKKLKEEISKMSPSASGEVLTEGELGKLYGDVLSGTTPKEDALKKMDELGLNVKDIGADDVQSVLNTLVKKDGPAAQIQVGLESGQMNKEEAIEKLKSNGIANPDDGSSVDSLKKLMLKLIGESAVAQHKIVQATTEAAIKAYMEKMKTEGGFSPSGIKKEVLDVISEMGKNRTETREEGRKFRRGMHQVKDKELSELLSKLEKGDITFEDAAKQLKESGGEDAKLSKDDAVKFLQKELDDRSTIRAALKRHGPGTVKYDLKHEIMHDLVKAQEAAALKGGNDTAPEGGEGGNSTKHELEKEMIDALRKQRQEFKSEMKKEFGELAMRATAKSIVSSLKMTNETVTELEVLQKGLENKEVTPADGRKKLEDLGVVDKDSITDEGTLEVVKSILEHKKARDEDRENLRKEVDALKAELTESIKNDTAAQMAAHMDAVRNATEAGAGGAGGGETSKRDDIRSSLKNLFAKAQHGTPEEVAELIKKQMESEGLVVTEGPANGKDKVKVDESSFEHAIYGEADGEMSFVCFVPK